MDREHVLSALRGPLLAIDVPEWGGTLTARKLTAAKLEELRELAPEAAEGETLPFATTFRLTAELLAWSILGDDGKPLLTAAEWTEFSRDCMEVVGRIAEAVQRHNGLMEDASKNSASGPATGST